nr:MAG TPA: hypothetical protein [Caudoviricetes sp.]
MNARRTIDTLVDSRERPAGWRPNWPTGKPRC